VRQRSRHIRRGNFTALGVDDPRLLVDLYDAEYFGGLLGRMLREDGAGELVLRVSSRMTHAAGKTIQRRWRVGSPSGPVERVGYEIAVSTLLLFPTFRAAGRPVTVGGRLAWSRSGCARPIVHALSRRIFGREGSVHDLVTPREVAAERHGIRVGDRVRFEHEGNPYSGRVNRITRRATVLVEDPRGRLFSDGKTYAIFYVPLPLLQGGRVGVTEQSLVLSRPRSARGANPDIGPDLHRRCVPGRRDSTSSCRTRTALVPMEWSSFGSDPQNLNRRAWCLRVPARRSALPTACPAPSPGERSARGARTGTLRTCRDGKPANLPNCQIPRRSCGAARA
jgi:hypothetical protein